VSAVRERDWARVLTEHAPRVATGQRLVSQLRACEASALAFCRLLELEPEVAEGRSWYGGPSAAELLEWDAVLRRAGVRVSSTRVAQAYLELAVLVRALEGLADSARMGSLPDSGSLWAGLFDLRENLLGQAVDDLRALAA